MVAQTAIRLATTGKAEVKQDFAETRKAGEDAFDGIAAAAEASGQKTATAADRAAERQEASHRRMAAAAKVAAISGAAQIDFNAALSGRGSGSQFATVNLDRSTGAARDAAEAFQELFRAEDAAALAAEKLAAASASAAAEARANAAQRRVDASLSSRGSASQFATVNLDRTTGSARESAAAFEAMFRAEDEAAAAAVKLRAAIDPLYVAQQRYETELKTWKAALDAGTVSQDEYTRAVRRTEKALEDEKRAAGDPKSRGLTTMQRQTLMYTASDIVASASSGTSLPTIAMQQGPQVLQAFAAEEGGLAKLLAVVNPLTVGVTALTAAIAAGALAWLSYNTAISQQTALAEGAGRVIGVTGQELEASAEAAARAGSMSVAAARELEAGYVQLGGIGTDVLSGLTALTTDFAAATGQDAAGAQQQLGAAFQDPIRGAQDLAERYGALTQEQIDHIQKLVEQGQLYAAQRELLVALQPAFDGAAEHARGFAQTFYEIRDAISDAWTRLGQFLNGASAAAPLAQRLVDLQAKRAQLGNTTAPGLRALIDKDIADVQAQMRREATRQDASRNAARQRAQDLSEDYTGDNRADISKRIGTLRAGIAAGGTPDQLKDWTAAVSANQHALDTWMPAQEKASRLTAIDARIAAAKTPAAKAALAAERERLDLAGKVVTGSDAETQAVAKGAAARAQAARSGEGHAATLAREAAAMDASARSALLVAAAYLESGAAGAAAEARRKALTDATKKGVDVEAQVRRQLAISVGDGIASSAKAVSDLRVESAARREANDNVAAGSLAVDDMNRRLQDEAALRPLLKLRAIAQGDALAALTRVVDAYRGALAEAHAEEGRSKALESLDALKERIADARLALQYAGDTSGAYEREQARRAAEREADRNGYSDGDRADVVKGNVDAASAELTARRAKSAADMLRNQTDGLELSRTEIGLVGKSAIEHDRVLASVQLQQQLTRDLGDDYERFAPAILAAADAAQIESQRLALIRNDMAEIEDFGSRFIDTLTNPNGDVLKSLLKEVEQELIKLAAINPLKNLLFGGGAPTLSSVFSLFTKAAGGIGSMSDLGLSSADSYLSMPDYDFSSSIGHFAAGTEYASGGMAYVGEHGPELVSLPTGSRVTTAQDTRRALAAANDRGPINVNVYADGAVLAAEVKDWVRAGVEEASVRGAYGGAQLARSDSSRRAARRIAR